MQPFLRAKLSPPVTRSATVRRSALSSLLAAGLKPLTLVTAPAGFGKTTLAAGKYAELRANGQAAAWVSLGPEDRDPFRFLTLLIEATRQVLPEVGQYAAKILETTPEISLRQVITHYLNDLVAARATLTLFIDDYHLAESAKNNEALGFLLRHAAGCLGIVLASRIAPALSLAALRVADCLIEINHDDLKFSVEETAEFVTQLHGVPLVREDIRTLQARTEGWAAGLQLATLSLKKRTDHGAFVRKFTGSVRDVADYLFSDVLCYQDEATREFLFRTSVLERMSGPLCDSLSGRSDAQQILERLEANNLFVVPMDDTRGWYRYHHLFWDFLHGRTLSSDPALARRLLLAACEFCAKHDLQAEAVTYALAAGDHDRAAALVVDHSIVMIYRGHMPQLVSWLKSIPDALVARYPRLLAIRCWMYFHIGKAALGEEALRAAESACVAAVADGPDSAAIREAELKTLRIALVMAADRCEDVCRDGKKLLAELGDRYPFLSGTAGNIVSASYLATANFDELRLVARRAREQLAAAECPYGLMYTYIFAGLCDLAQGRLREAVQAVEFGLDVATRQCGEDSFPAAIARCVAGMVDYERNDLERAQAILEQNLPLIRECGVLEIQRLASVCLARLSVREKDFVSAQRVLDDLERSNHDDGQGATRAVLIHERIRLLEREPGGVRRMADVLHAGGLSAAEAPVPGWDRVRDEIRMAQARSELALGHPEGVLALLLPLKARLEAIDFRRKLEEVAIQIARAYLSVGQDNAARKVLGELWADREQLAASSRYREEGDDVRKQLDKLMASSEAVGSLRNCAGALSGRELAVLQLLATGHQTRRVAGELGISEHTVKWHVKNILEKFGVSSRLSAVAHARETGLIR